MTESEILQKLDLGTAKSVLQNKPGSPLGSLLQDMIQDVIEQLQQAMKNRNINTSSASLSQSIAPTEVKFNGDSVEIGLTMEHYWKYVNYGVNGSEVSRNAPAWGSAPSAGKSFRDSIKEWIPKRGLSLPESFKSYDQFAFAIMTNIIKRGKEGRPFFEDVVNDNLIQVMREPIESIVGRSIEIAIVSPFK